MKTRYIIMTICLFLTFSWGASYGLNQDVEMNKPKTTVIILDQLDFITTDYITSDNDGVGIINNRTASLYKKDGKESFFMSIASGRRVKVKQGLFQGVNKRGDGTLKVIDFDNIYNNLINNSDSPSGETILFGDFFINHNIDIGYIGEGASSLIAANRDGIIKYGTDVIKYEKEWIVEKTEKVFENAEILIVEYNIMGMKSRLNLLKEYISEISDTNILILSYVPLEDKTEKLNNTLALSIYKSPYGQKGLLYSTTTKREGIITNLDVFPHIASIYGLDNPSFIGNKIEVHNNGNNTSILKDTFLKISNLNILRYFFHFLIILLELVVLVVFFINEKKKLDFPRVYIQIVYTILSAIFVSFIGYFLRLHTNIVLYIIVVSLSSVVITYGLLKFKLKIVDLISAGTYLIILYGVFFDKELLYNSFIGYNNIIAGGRFYGMNNGIIGVLLATSIISYYSITKWCSRPMIKIIMFSIFITNIVAASSYFGANTGGYLTGIVLLLIVLYVEFFEDLRQKKGNKIVIVLITVLGLTLLIGNYYIDMVKNVSHTGSLIERTLQLGYLELWNMILRKLKQLVFMVLVPPWSIIFIAQIFFISRIYKSKKDISRDKKDKKILIIFREMDIIIITSIIGLLVNDTGVIAFVYMNTYVIARIASLHNL